MKQQRLSHRKSFFISRARARNIFLSGLVHSTGLIIFIFSAALFLFSVKLDAATNWINELSSTNEFQRAKAAIALGQAKDQNAVDDLTDRFNIEESKKVKIYILQALLQIPWQDKVSFFETALGDSDADVRLKSAMILQQFEMTSSNPALLNALNDVDDRVKAAAAVALRGGNTAKNTLITLANNENPSVKAQAILGLSAIHAQGADVNSVVQSALSDENSEVRSAAQWSAEALGIEVAP